MNHNLKRAALAICGILLALLITEVIARLFYTKPWHEKLIEEQGPKSSTASIKRNRFGLRDRDYSEEKTSDTTRVLLLGDSFTYGSGVAREDAIFAELLESQLNSLFSQRRKRVEILNGGIPGTRTHVWLDLLSNVKDSFKPDVILVVFFLRDGTRIGSIDGFFGPIRNEITAENLKSPAYQNLYLYRWYKDSRDRLKISGEYTKALTQSYFGNQRQTREWRMAQSNLLQIKTIAQRDGATIGLVIFPVLVELNDRYPFTPICETVAQFGLTNKIPTLNLLDAFMHKDAADLWVSAYDQHPNELGHKIAADAMLPFLNGLIAKAK